MNADEFNALYAVGTPVFAYPGARPEDVPSATRLVTRTRSHATVFGGHTAVVWVDGERSCIALTHVDVVSEDAWLAANLAAADAEATRSKLADPSPATDPITAARGLDLLALMDECAASKVSPALAALLDMAETLQDRVAELEAERQESTPIPARWDRTAILPEHPNGDSDGDTIICCIADDGRPIGLFLNDEHREALGLLLIDPHGDTEGVAR